MRCSKKIKDEVRCEYTRHSKMSYILFRRTLKFSPFSTPQGLNIGLKHVSVSAPEVISHYHLALGGSCIRWILFSLNFVLSVSYISTDFSTLQKIYQIFGLCCFNNQNIDCSPMLTC